MAITIGRTSLDGREVPAPVTPAPSAARPAPAVPRGPVGRPATPFPVPVPTAGGIIRKIATMPSVPSRPHRTVTPLAKSPVPYWRSAEGPRGCCLWPDLAPASIPRRILACLASQSPRGVGRASFLLALEAARPSMFAMFTRDYGREHTLSRRGPTGSSGATRARGTQPRSMRTRTR